MKEADNINSSVQPIFVRVNKQFSALPDRVFDAWIDPDQIGKWMFGPNIREETILQLKTCPKPGGSFSFLVKRGGMEIDHVGNYLEFNRPELLKFTWGIAGHSTDESIVTIEISPWVSGCELKLTHTMDPKWAEYKDRTEAGWTRMLNKLAEVL